jgi:hypothetical protein
MREGITSNQDLSQKCAENGLVAALIRIIVLTRMGPLR